MVLLLCNTQKERSFDDYSTIASVIAEPIISIVELEESPDYEMKETDQIIIKIPDCQKDTFVAAVSGV